MANVLIEGTFMGANLKTSTFDGKSKTSLYIDVYQPKSESNEKMVQLKSDDVELFQYITSNFDMGSIFKAEVTVNAYKNKAYFKLAKVVE